MKYEIWQDNGISTIFESDSTWFCDVLDEFCAKAGYIDQSDYMSKLNLTVSPFNIKQID
jgi:hypothetical protein